MAVPRLPSGASQNGGDSMRCPECGTDILHVYQTQHFENEIIRRRICEHQHKFRTIEVIADDVKVKNGEPDVTVDLTRYRLK
jgi:transcriptional regulator NrdR family protein